MITLKNITKKYNLKNDTVFALDKINLNIKNGEFVIIRGPSGSGKTTLLMCLGGMLQPTTGNIAINNIDLYKLSNKKRTEFRAENIGFIFQMFHLLPYLNVWENIQLPLGTGIKMPHQNVEKIIKQMDILKRKRHKPSQLSTGEKQRTALARALYAYPKIILADEPTGNLDPENAAIVISYLKKFQDDGGTVVIVTHGKTAINYSTKIINLKSGQVSSIKDK